MVGLPVGIAAGSLLWRRFADNLGVITEVDLRPAVFLLIAVGGLLVAFVLAVLPARRGGSDAAGDHAPVRMNGLTHFDPFSASETVRRSARSEGFEPPTF